MAKAADQFRAADVTGWGIVALVCWASAVFLGNVSALLPPSALAGLHASRLDGGTVGQLRLQVAEIAAENERMRQENNLLLRRLEMQQQAQGDVIRRVGALEGSLPSLLEQQRQPSPVDTSVTASIVSGEARSFEAEGGSVTVNQRPLIGIGAPPRQAVQPASPVPAPVTPDGSTFAVALGFPIAPDDGELQWQGLMARVGTLLIGLQPVLAETEGSDGVTIVAGPIATQSQAAELCDRLDRVGIPCKPASFKGEPLPLLN